jgi:hypothetical protein
MLQAAGKEPGKGEKISVLVRADARSFKPEVSKVY